MFRHKKRNYHETIHDGAIGIYGSAVCMESRFVGHRFLKQAKIAWVIDLIDAMPSRANFPNAVCLLKKTLRLSEQRTKERSCVCKQN